MGIKAFRQEMEQIRAEEELAQKIIAKNDKKLSTKRRKNERAKEKEAKIRILKLQEQVNGYKEFDYAMKMSDLELCSIVLENLNQVDPAYKRKNKSIALQGIERGYLTNSQKFSLSMAYNDFENPIKPIFIFHNKSFNHGKNQNKSQNPIAVLITIFLFLIFSYFFIR